MEGVKFTGMPSAEELANCPGVPSEERKKKGILPPKELDGYLKRSAKMVTSSNTGAVFED